MACLTSKVRCGYGTRKQQNCCIRSTAHDLAKSDRFTGEASEARSAALYLCNLFSGRRTCISRRVGAVRVLLVQQQVLVAKFRVSHRRDVEDSDDEGVMERVKSVRREYADDDDDDLEALPGSTTRKAGNALASRDVSRVNAVAFSPTGSSFCACTPGALLFYRKDDATNFAPFDVDEAATLKVRAGAGRGTISPRGPWPSRWRSATRRRSRRGRRGHLPGVRRRLCEGACRRTSCLDYYGTWRRASRRTRTSSSTQFGSGVCCGARPEEVLRDEAPALREATRSLLLHKRALSSLVDDNENALAFLLSEVKTTLSRGRISTATA